jgi:hypothetical protein
MNNKLFSVYFEIEKSSTEINNNNNNNNKNCMEDKIYSPKTQN